ncbi:MAG: (2Fe-2S)-binding protein [Desulfarculus sp.]|nr:(2Fe-2S)-binding protein [Desulfarculus sp.]
MAKQNIDLNVNGFTYRVAVEPWRSLAEVLREELGLTGTKVGCNQGDCGACTVLIDGRAVSSCLTLAVEAHQRQITTIEGLAASPDQLHPIQQAFIDHGAVQCGFCTAGMILSAKALLDQNPDPSEEEIRQGIAGNLCRCTGYVKIVEAISAAAQTLRGPREER